MNSSTEEKQTFINENQIEKDEKYISEHNVAIFDWDDTLFCTKYLEMFKLDYKELFQEKTSIDQIATFLYYEIRKLEDVK
jgi:hypothetical protein